MKLQRMCVACRRMGEKSEFFRIVKKEGQILLDNAGKTEGRGAYLCKSAACVLKAKKGRALERSLSCKVDEAVYAELEALCSDE